MKSNRINLHFNGFKAAVKMSSLRDKSARNISSDVSVKSEMFQMSDGVARSPVAPTPTAVSSSTGTASKRPSLIRSTSRNRRSKKKSGTVERKSERKKSERSTVSEVETGEPSIRNKYRITSRTPGYRTLSKSDLERKSSKPKKREVERLNPMELNTAKSVSKKGKNTIGSQSHCGLEWLEKQNSRNDGKKERKSVNSKKRVGKSQKKESQSDSSETTDSNSKGELYENLSAVLSTKALPNTSKGDDSSKKSVSKKKKKKRSKTKVGVSKSERPILREQKKRDSDSEKKAGRKGKEEDVFSPASTTSTSHSMSTFNGAPADMERDLFKCIGFTEKTNAIRLLGEYKSVLFYGASDKPGLYFYLAVRTPHKDVVSRLCDLEMQDGKRRWAVEGTNGDAKISFVSPAEAARFYSLFPAAIFF